MKPIVLVIAPPEDPHLKVMVPHLEGRGAEVVCWHIGGFPAESTISAHLQSGAWCVQLNKSLHLEEIHSIWNRRARSPVPVPDETTKKFPDETTKKFVDGEAAQAVYGLLGSLRRVKWVNHPQANRVAGYKLVQLQTASQCGLAIPETLVTNDPVMARDFFDGCGGEVIYKTLRQHTLAEGATIYTSEVLPEHLERDMRAGIRDTAHLFQKKVPKELELRSMVIGKRILTAEIYSQHSESSRIDFRRGYDDLRYGIHDDLPLNLQVKLLRFMDRMDLAFGMIDFILTPGGEYVFLEVNPSGQWYWLEKETGLPMCDALADYLVEGEEP